MHVPSACPLCGRTKGLKPKYLLYGHVVCRKCRTAFANRRQLAWIIDIFAMRVVQILVAIALATAVSWAGMLDEDAQVGVGIAALSIYMVLIATKDGFHGRSLGRAITGVRVVDQDTNEPIGFGKSILRNLLVFVPLAPLVMAVQMINGPRSGDGWTKTKVVWSKYAGNPVFGGNQWIEPTWIAEAVMTSVPSRETGNPYQTPS
ncbi:MAG: RDD family protein [Pirellulaceae bacterium]